MIQISIQERKEREKMQMKEKILSTAIEILKKEGIGGISIRKIADGIEYSPAIIYHYFKDKDDILSQILEITYRQMLKSISSENGKGLIPEYTLREKIRKFIDLAVQMGDEYKVIMFSDSSKILEKTAVLYKGAAAERPAIAMLVNSLRDVKKYKAMDENSLEIVSQVIWASMFGLILRMITEKTERNQKERLVNSFLDFILFPLDKDSPN